MKYYEAECLCLNLRQKAILFSILICILTVLITSCAVLGSLHTKQLLHLLADDIEGERAKCHCRTHCKSHDFNVNEMKLLHSEETISIFDKIVTGLVWLSFANLTASAFLIYGVINKNSSHIIPWLILSLITYLLCGISLIILYPKMMPQNYHDYGFEVFSTAIIVSFIYLMLWTGIDRYYNILWTSVCESHSTTVQSYGGYSHTVKPLMKFCERIEDKLVV